MGEMQTAEVREDHILPYGLDNQCELTALRKRRAGTENATLRVDDMPSQRMDDIQRVRSLKSALFQNRGEDHTDRHQDACGTGGVKIGVELVSKIGGGFALICL